MMSLMSILGAMMLLGGSVGFFFITDGLKMGLREFINLDEGGMVFPQFMRPPKTPESTYYIYAIRNITQVLQGMKASFTLKGPYKFRTTISRDKVRFSGDKERLAFVWNRELIWDDANSSNPDEKIWTLNPILPSTIFSARMLINGRIPFGQLVEQVVYNSINVLLDNYNERLFQRTTPRKLLDGRVVGLLDDLVNLAKRFGVDFLLPPTPPDNVFGLVYVQNRTFYDVEVWTGLGRTKDKFAEVSKFRGKDRIEMWSGRCNSITGTNGELFKPFLVVGKQLRIFLAPLCRSLDLDPVGTDLVRTKSGVMALEYELGRGLFQGAQSKPDNMCFCTETSSVDCQHDGLVSMGPCFYDSPLYFARTNFRGASSKISNLVDLKSASVLNGTVNPNWQMPSQQIFRIEPISGSILEVDISLLVTFKVFRQPHVRDLAKVQKLTYMPLTITQDTISLPYELIWQLYYLQKFYDYHRPIMAGVAGLGLGAMVLRFLLGVF